MSSLVNLTEKPVTIQGFQLTSSSDMYTALNYLTGFGYTGQVNVQNPGGTLTWTLALYDAKQNTSQTANINDVIVIQNGSVATVVAAADFPNLYTVAT